MNIKYNIQNRKITWEQRKLKEILKVNSGKDYKHLKFGEVPVYGTGGYMLSVNETLSKIDAVGLGRKGTINKPRFLKAPFWTVDTLFYMTPHNNLDTYFMYYLISNTGWKKYDESTGVPSLSKKTIENVQKYYPDLNEQNNIAAFLKKLDYLINLHQRKSNILRNLKHSYLSVIFTNKNETLPHLRFKFFTEAWEQRELKDLVGESSGGGTPRTSIGEFWNGEIPWIQSSDLKTDNLHNLEIVKYISNKGLENSSAKLIPSNSITIVTRVGVGKLVKMPYPFATSQDFLSLSYLKNDINFLTYLLSKTMKNLKKRLQGTSIKGIPHKELLQVTLKIPNNNAEELKIGILLVNIDKLIALHQQKINILINIKGSLLKKLFI